MDEKKADEVTSLRMWTLQAEERTIPHLVEEPASSSNTRHAFQCPWCDFVATVGWAQYRGHVKICPHKPEFNYEEENEANRPQMDSLTPPQRKAQLDYLLGERVQTG